MDQKLEALCRDLETDIQHAYEEGTTLDNAERLAAKFLGAQMTLASTLASLDLDARMKKTGLKAVKAAVYLEEATKGDKKPSDVMLGAIVDRSSEVLGQQDQFDAAEVIRDRVQNIFNIAKEGHIYFRGISKGRFE